MEQREQKDRVKLEWLRTAAQEGFGAIESGDYAALNSEEELDELLVKIRKEVMADLESEPERG